MACIRHYTQRDLADAAADVTSTKQAWDRYGCEVVSWHQVEDARRQVRATRGEIRKLTAWSESVLQSLRLGCLRATHAVQRLLGLEDGYAWIIALLCGFIAVVLITPPVVYFRPSPSWAVAVWAVAFLVTTGVGMILILPTRSVGLERAIGDMVTRRKLRAIRTTELRTELRQLEDGYHWVRGVYKAQHAHEQAVAWHQELTTLLASERNRLQTANWRALRGVDFERFLARVFELLGYQVQLTKASGDQGVDLIVVKNGRRIAIQSKGYSASVGNSAVQEAHAGKTFYRCTEAVVITNSKFTSGAENLAQSVGCRLVDGAQIPFLIDGRIY